MKASTSSNISKVVAVTTTTSSTECTLTERARNFLDTKFKNLSKLNYICYHIVYWGTPECTPVHWGYSFCCTHSMLVCRDNHIVSNGGMTGNLISDVYNKSTGQLNQITSHIILTQIGAAVTSLNLAESSRPDWNTLIACRGGQ